MLATPATLGVAQSYWIIAIVVMGMGGLLEGTVLYWFWKLRKNHHPITLAFLLVLVPDALVILNFFPYHLYHLAKSGVPDDGYCMFSAVLTVSSTVACNMGSSE